MQLNKFRLGLYRRYRVLLMCCTVVFLICLCYVLLNRPKYMDKTVIDVNKWLENPTTGCRGHFTAYGNEFVLLRNARVGRTRNMFSIPCEDEIPGYNFLHGKEGTILQEWMNNLGKFPYSEMSKFQNSAIDTATIAVMRYEAHNLYHTLCEWYNVFILTKMLRLDPKHVNILLMDDRPSSLMDETWSTLFGKVHRYSDLSPDAVFKNLIWNVIGYESPLNFHNLEILPYVDIFYNFFIKSFGVNKLKSLNCEQLQVTIIWRKDYMTHPERQKETGGLVHRKFKNEDEILQVVQDVFPGHSVKPVILEEMDMRDQVKLFTNTDILFGMHGAGMSHVMFLPPHAAVFETFPSYWGFLKHFKAFSRWRGIKYLGWQNSDPKNEYPDFYTRIPPDVIRTHLKELNLYLCPS